MDLRTIGKIIVTLAIGWILVVLADTAWGQTPLTASQLDAVITRLNQRLEKMDVAKQVKATPVTDNYQTDMNGYAIDDLA